MSPRISETENAMGEMRLILRYMQYEGGLSDRGKATLDKLADGLGITRDQLNRYLGQLGTSTDILERHRVIATNLYSLLKDKRDLPPHIKAMLSDIYGEGAFPSAAAVVTSDRVIGHRSLVTPSTTEEPRDLLTPLEGLNVIVRPANESVRVDDPADPMSRTSGWSISILNVPPEHVQAGDHHPVFKIRQIGQNRNELTIEGVVVPRSDRITFQGITIGEQRPVQAVITRSDERLALYRNGSLQATQATSLLGIYTGVSSGGASFTCLIETFAVPNSALPKGATRSEVKAFENVYEAAKQASGVRDLDSTVTTLEKLGIHVTRDQLLDMFTRSMGTPILSAF